MSEPKRPSGRETNMLDFPPGLTGSDACDMILISISRASFLDEKITIWDLPQSTGLQLHEAFAAVRTLEFGRLVKVEDNPSDPFGATLEIEPTAADRIARLRAA